MLECAVQDRPDMTTIDPGVEVEASLDRSSVVAQAVMERYAVRTGLTGDLASRRYLWTDAFAVCNFLGLGRPELALALVERVHHELGRHRADDSRSGWISGAADADGEAHPTRGGLRIGKPLPERSAGAPFDDALEWERDGQYFHYLTKWMHALAQVARATGDSRYERWARELAEAAYRGFVHPARGGRGIWWKVSIDLSRPLVASMGHHDPLDGYITGLELEATARILGTAERGPALGAAIAAYRSMIDTHALASSDPLGIGGLLADASRLVQLGADPPLLDAVIAAAVVGLRAYASRSDLRQRAEHRLAFRELGLAIGLADAASIDPARFTPFVRLGQDIAAFWLEPAHRRTQTWIDHEDINEVMLATSLAPRGFLTLGAGAASRT